MRQLFLRASLVLGIFIWGQSRILYILSQNGVPVRPLLQALPNDLDDMF